MQERRYSKSFSAEPEPEVYLNLCSVSTTVQLLYSRSNRLTIFVKTDLGICIETLGFPNKIQALEDRRPGLHDRRLV